MPNEFSPSQQLLSAPTLEGISRTQELNIPHTTLSLQESESHVNGDAALGDVAPAGAQNIVLEQHQNRNWLISHWRLLAAASAVGGVALDLAVTHTNMQLQAIEQKALELAPWAGPGLIGSEALWLGGAALLLYSAGRAIGNPLTFHERWRQAAETAQSNPLYNIGLAINTLGALGTAGVATAATISTLPHEAWPGAAALIGADVLQTLTTRVALVQAHRVDTTEDERPNIEVRHAMLDDIDSIVELDRRLFKGAYGETLPSREEATVMFTKRLQNNPDGMLITLVDGQIKGFVTAFRTNKPIKSFVSWEDSTANGTLDGRVDSKGRYLYIANLTFDTHGAEGATDVLLAHVVAQAIEDGVVYGYFCRRMPGFRNWATRLATRIGVDMPTGEALTRWAEVYAGLEKPDKKGRPLPLDPELKFYRKLGFKKQKVVPDAFADYKSMNYQVPFKAKPPLIARLTRGIAPIRRCLAAGIRLLTKHPKLMEKVL